MCKILELLRLFVCLGDLLSFLVPGGTEKIAGMWFVGGGGMGGGGGQYPGGHYVFLKSFIIMFVFNSSVLWFC